MKTSIKTLIELLKAKYLSTNLLISKKKMIFFFTFILFAHHLGVTILYLLPPNPMTNYYMKYTLKYMYPFFFQKWNLFAPEPSTYSLKMFYQCQNENQKWLNWKDPMHELIKTHQKNRFTFYGKLIYIYHGMFRNLANKKIELKENLNCNIKDKDCLNKLNLEIHHFQEYKLLNKFVSYLCAKETKGIQHKFKLLQVYSRNFSERNNPQAKKRVTIDSYTGVRDLTL